MDSVGAWFNNLHIFGKCLVILFSLPVVFLLVGSAVMEPPGDSLWGTHKPKWWQVWGGTMAIGFVSSALLAAIFGGNYLIYHIFSSVGLGQDWVLTAAFIICLIGVLFGVYWWFEGRHDK